MGGKGGMDEMGRGMDMGDRGWIVEGGKFSGGRVGCNCKGMVGRECGGLGGSSGSF